MKAIIRATGEVIEVEHDNLGDRGSSVAFYSKELNKTFSIGELDFGDSTEIDWEQRFFQLASNLFTHRQHHSFPRGLTVDESIEMATIFINQLKQQSDE